MLLSDVRVCEGEHREEADPQERNFIAACYGEENADKVIQALLDAKPDPAFEQMFEEVKAIFFGPVSGESMPRTSTLRNFVARNEPIAEEMRKQQLERKVIDILMSEPTNIVKQKRTLGDVARERRKR
ncbi:MAG: hypothetical protein M3362_00580 [Acidobacteriota bacterium]|nr:hypothetical protein [Acidobacteriota bacterium]